MRETDKSLVNYLVKLAEALFPGTEVGPAMAHVGGKAYISYAFFAPDTPTVLGDVGQLMQRTLNDLKLAGGVKLVYRLESRFEIQHEKDIQLKKTFIKLRTRILVTDVTGNEVRLDA